MKKIFVFALSIMLLFIACGCNNADNSSTRGAEKTVIAVSISPEAAFAEKVCGDDFKIVTVIPAGASPETYEPTPQIMKELSSAKLYFSIGVQAEDFILPYLSSSTEVVELHKSAAEIYPELTINGGRDPHIWLSVKRAELMVADIAEAVGKIKPENAAKYTANAENYIAELSELDKNIKSLISESGGNKFIAFHPAFGYFADEYSLKMYALEEDGKEATPKRLAEMVDLAKKEKIKVIFYQSESSSKQALAFAEEIGGEAVMLEPLSYNYTENLENMAKAISKAVK